MTVPHLRAPPMLAGRAGSATVSPAPRTGQQAPSTHPHSSGQSPYPHCTPWKLRLGGSGFCLTPKLLLESSVATLALGGEARRGRESEDGAKLPASTVASYLGQARGGQRREGLMLAVGVLEDG